MIYRSIFFIHLAKTGGTTIESLLRETYGEENVCPYAYDSEFLENANSRLPYKVFIGHNPYYVSQVLPKPVFIFTFLRNPLDRVISAYNHIRRDTAHEFHKRLGVSGDLVKDFIENPRLPQACNAQTRSLGADADFAAAVRAVRRGAADADKIYQQILAARHAAPMAEVFQTARERLARMDFVGITERFEESVRLLFSLLDSFYEKPIPVLNKAPRHNRVDLGDFSAEQLRITRDANTYDARLHEFAQRRLDFDARNPVLRRFKWTR